jgi:Flp pilus assembly secretin CpaC
MLLIPLRAVSSKYIVERAADVAVGYVEKKENVVNLLKQQEGVASNQVMLRERFAEISRSALQELGISFFTDGNNNRYGRVTTQQFARRSSIRRTPTWARRCLATTSTCSSSTSRTSSAP